METKKAIGNQTCTECREEFHNEVDEECPRCGHGKIKPKQNPKDWVKAEFLSYKQNKELFSWLSSDVFDLTPSMKEIVRKLGTQVQNHEDMYGVNY